jgi:hypothetical protein
MVEDSAEKYRADAKKASPEWQHMELVEKPDVQVLMIEFNGLALGWDKDLLLARHCKVTYTSSFGIFSLNKLFIQRNPL